MLLTKVQWATVEKDFDKIETIAYNSDSQLFNILENCNDEELMCMKYLYAYMPLSDLANYDGGLFLNFVRHGLKLRRIIPWADQLQGLLFMNYVLQYRVNNENIEFYSEIFFDELNDRIKGMSMYEAAIEVNYWCYEKATYQGTDIRTLSPLSTMRRAFGRCGEESVLTVAALRSVGIPARQCYVPRWVHCDDNHAWVEAWIDGKWHFLGACEPEAKLDRGWFTGPASKSMLVHSRVFSPLVDEKSVTFKSERMTEINMTSHYGTTTNLEVKVIDKGKGPVKGLELNFLVVNYGELYPLAKLRTDKNGCVSFLTGLGDLIVYAREKEWSVFEKIDLRVCNYIELVVGENAFVKERVMLDLVPPVGGIDDYQLSEQELELHKARSLKAESGRKNYESTFYDEEKGRLYSEKFGQLCEEITSILINSAGNHETIKTFLDNTKIQGELIDKVKMLASMKKKDVVDITLPILEEHFKEGMFFREKYKQELPIFYEFVLNPRIETEMITEFRKWIKDYFGAEQKELFVSHPKTIGDYVTQFIESGDELDCNNICASPRGTLRLGKGSAIAKKALVVAIARTFGVAARIESVYGKTQYYRDGKWHSFEKEANWDGPKGRLTLISERFIKPMYKKEFTLSRFQEGDYRNLDLSSSNWNKHQIEYSLDVGNYRLTVAYRLDDGSLKSCFEFFEIKEHEHKIINLYSNDEKQEKKRGDEIDVFPNIDLDAKTTSIKLVDGIESKSALIWIEMGTEPVEHLFNELLELAKEYNKYQIQILFIVNSWDETNYPKLIKLLEQIPKTKVYLSVGYEEEIVNVCKSYDVNDKRLPLVFIIDKSLRVSFASSGYRVGLGQFLINKIRTY